MKILFYTFIKDSLPVNKYVGEIQSSDSDVIKTTYVASSGLLDCSCINYNQTGNVYDSDSERRKVGTKNAWDVKI